MNNLSIDFNHQSILDLYHENENVTKMHTHTRSDLVEQMKAAKPGKPVS